MLKRKYLICILQHRQVHYAINTFLHLHNALRQNDSLRKNCKIVIACSKHGSRELRNLRNIFGGDYDLDIFECNPDYLEKLRCVFEKYPRDEYPFFVKCDEDISLSGSSWTRLLELSEQELTDPRTLLTSVNLSTGLPSWSRFAETFLTSGEKHSLYKRLKTDQVPDHAWGQNYESVNEFIRALAEWDEAAYWRKVNSLPSFYKGVHPVRFRLDYAWLMNRAVLDRYSKFQEALPQSEFERISDRYFCNSLFVIGYGLYQAILKDKSLYVDAFDEVPLNTYRAQKGMSFSFLKGSLGVHILYNSAYDENGIYEGKRMSGQAMESSFLAKYLSCVRSHLKASGCRKTERVTLPRAVPAVLKRLYHYLQ